MLASYVVQYPIPMKRTTMDDPPNIPPGMGPAAHGPVFDHTDVNDSVTEDIAIEPYLKMLRAVSRPSSSSMVPRIRTRIPAAPSLPGWFPARN